MSPVSPPKQVPTNGDVMAARLGGLRESCAYARSHPDEVAVLAAPYAVAVFISLRRRLPFPEHMLICELGALAGVAALNEYRRWKAQPAPAVTALRGVRLWKLSRSSSPGLSPSA